MIHLSATADSCVTQSACVEHIDWAKEAGIPISKGKAFFVITNIALAFDQCNSYSLHEHYVAYSECFQDSRPMPGTNSRLSPCKLA